MLAGGTRPPLRIYRKAWKPRGLLFQRSGSHARRWHSATPRNFNVMRDETIWRSPAEMPDPARIVNVKP
jgi:hypothetical protein